MRIAVFGTGGAGGYFGAQLALAGEDVVFIARGDHLRAMKSTGLRLETPSGETVIRAEATDKPTEIGHVEAVLVGVKAWQVTEAARARNRHADAEFGATEAKSLTCGAI